MNTPRKCLSIRQPWAWLILRPDLTGDARKEWMTSRLRKDIENRKWNCNYRGKLWIHAGTNPDRDGMKELREKPQFYGGIILPDTFATGGIVGTVSMVACVTTHPSPWFTGRGTGGFGFIFEDPEPIEFEPLRGQLKIFDA